MLLFKVLINTYMWHALLVSDEIDQFDDDLLMKKLALDLRPPQRGATVTEGLRRRPVHKWSRPTGGRLKSRELCLTSTSNHSDPQVNPLCPTPPTNYILSSAYTPSCYRRPSKRTTSGLQTRNPWQTSRPHHCAPWHSNRHLLQKDSTTSLPCWLTLKWRLPINGCDL